MARQIEYDPTAVRQNLLAVFWSQGFAETSLTDLEGATGLNRRQLYNGVGDKRSMFLQALDDFADQAGQQFLAPLERPEAGVAEIAGLLETFLELLRSGGEAKGCLVCSTSQEEIVGDPDVKARVDAYFTRIRAAYRNALVCAVQSGALSLSEPEIEGRTESLFATHVALCILARAGRPYDQLERMVRQALDDI